MTLSEQMTSIANEVAALEQVVEQQRSIIAELQKEAETAKAKDTLIDLVGPDIEWQEKHLTMRSSDRLQKIIEVYRQLRPGGARDEN